MAKLDKAEPSTIAWVDLQTPDLEKAQRFYGPLLGWSFVGGEDPATAFYVMGQIGGRNVAGMARLRPDSPFAPQWSIYFATTNADETARKVAEAGGQVTVPPMDVMDQGRMAYFADPTGASFGIWQGKRHLGAEVVEEPGAMTWHEVYTRDANRSLGFYARVFGLEPKRLEAPGIDYWTLQRGPRTVCGLMQMTEQFAPEVLSHWNTYFAVGNVDESAQQVAALGGQQVVPPFDTPYGRMIVVADPFGAPFCLIKPNSPSSNW